jgi:hypothetical protein
MEIIESIKKHLLEISLGHIAFGTLSFIGGFLFNYLRARRQDRRFRKFFGGKRKVERIRVVYGQFTELVNPGDKANLEFANAQKIYHIGKKRIVNVRRFSEFAGASTITAVNYISNELLKHKHFPSKVYTDVEAVKNYSHSFISIGGPASNELTDSLMDRRDNIYFEFEIPDNPTPSSLFELYKKTPNGNVKLERLQDFDYGIIIRLDNKHEHDVVKDSVYFVCAGLGSHGTSGACYYLANNWNNLYDRFKTDEFGMLLKIRKGAETDVEVVDMFSKTPSKSSWRRFKVKLRQWTRWKK